MYYIQKFHIESSRLLILLLVNCFITLHGLPAAITFGGMFLVTTLLAPITEFSPIVTPLSTTLFTPNQTLSSITTSSGGPVLGSSKCQSASVIKEFAPQRTL